jgi:hypothetical protein
MHQLMERRQRCLVATKHQQLVAVVVVVPTKQQQLVAAVVHQLEYLACNVW